MANFMRQNGDRVMLVTKRHLIEKINENLGKWEQIKKIELTPKIWTIDDGLLTPTLKLKRKAIKEEFQDLYDRMYKS